MADRVDRVDLLLEPAAVQLEVHAVRGERVDPVGVTPGEPTVKLLSVGSPGVGVAEPGQERAAVATQLLVVSVDRIGQGRSGGWHAHLLAAARTARQPTTTQRHARDLAHPPVYATRYSSAMSKSVPVREFRTHLADLLDEVADRREHVTVTRRGRPAAVLVPVDEYEALEETAEILSDEDTLAAIRRGLDDLTVGEITSLDDVRAEHAARFGS